MKFVAATLLSLIATLLGMIVLLSAWVLTTESGLRFAVHEMHTLMPKVIRVGAVDGRLIGPLRLRDLDLKTATSQLTAQSVDFDWSPSRLFFARVVINRLHVRNANLIQYKSAPAQKSKSKASDLLALLHSPLAVELHDIGLQDFEYRAPGSKPFLVQHAELVASLDAHGLHIDKLQASGPQFAIRGHATVDSGGEHASQGELNWQWRLSDYPKLVGHTVLSGSLRKLQIKQRIEKPYRTHATVVLDDVLTAPHFVADVQLNAVDLRAIRPDLPNLTVDATAHAMGHASAIDYTARAKAVDPERGSFMLALDGTLAEQIITIQQLTLVEAHSPTRLLAKGNLDLARKPFTLDLKAEWQKLRWPLQGEPRFTSPRGNLDITGTPQDLTARIDAAVGDGGGINGQIRREHDHINLALDWHNLQWPLQQPRLLLPQGKAQIAGTLQHYSLSVATVVEAPSQPGGHLILQGTGSRQSLALSRIDLKVLQGELNGNAHIIWQPQLDGRISLTGSGLDPGILLPDWPGKLAMRLQASAVRQDGKLEAQLAALDLTGRLRGEDFRLQARGDYRNEVLQLKRFSLNSGSSTVQASGTIGQTLGVDWRIDSNNLATLLPGASGSLHSKGQARGELRRPQIRATLLGKDIHYADYAVDRLNLNADLDLQGKARSSIMLALQGGQAAGIKLSTVRFTGQGTPQAHRFALAAKTSAGDANLHLNGSLQQTIWSFQLTQARLKYPTLPAWSLAATAHGQLSAKLQQMERTCWTSTEGELCIQGQRTAAGLQGAFQLQDLPFSYFAAFMPTQVDLKGRLSGQGEFKRSGHGVPTANVQLHTTAGTILSSSGENKKKTTLLRFQPASIHADLGNQGLRLDAALPFVKQGGLNLHAEIPQGSAALTERPLSGQIRVEMRDIGFLAELVPNIKQIGGQLQGQMRISGTLARPALIGRLALRNGSAQLVGTGLQITDLTAEVVGQQGGGMQYSASAKSGGGTMHLAGTADLTGKVPTAEMNINGKDFQALNTMDGRVFVSPTLQVSLDAAGITVNGEVRVPRAEITPKKIPPSAVAVSDDQVIVEPNQQKTVIAKARKIHARIRLILGNSVHFDGFGLKGRLAGRLLIVEQPDKPTTGSGELRIVKGEYRAYGQGLVIETGRILFGGGPIDQPGVEVRAVRHPAEGITVGVQVHGSLKQPEFTIFSQPSMTQAEQLSWLILGRPLQNTSQSESSMLSQAALAIGLKGGDYLAKRLGNVIGVDTFGIETGSGEAGAASNPQQAALVIGKYLTPKIYISYGIGLFEPVSTVKLQYTVNSHWKLATESSSVASGGDVIYTIER